MSDNPGFGGYADTSFGKDNSNEAKGFDPGLANDITAGAYAQPGVVSEDLNNEDKTGAPVNTPDDRNLAEKAAGWLGEKVQGKIDSVMNNPLGALVNAAMGMVPMAGAFNTISGLLGGPTIGAAVPGIVNAMQNGIVDEQAPDVLAGFTGNTFEDQNWDAGRIRYYRLADGSITSRLIKSDGSVQAVASGVKAAV